MGKFTNNKHERFNKGQSHYSKMETARLNLEKASKSGNQAEIDKAIREADIAKQEVAASLQEEREANEMANSKNVKTNTKVETKKGDTKDKSTVVKEEVKKEEIVNDVKANMVADGQATVEQANVAGDSKEVQDKAQEVADKINDKKKEPTVEELQAIARKAKEEKEAKANAPKDETPIKEETPKQEVKNKTPKDETPKQESTTKSASNNKKTLVPKMWQRVSEDGKSLINVITFLGEKLDYSVGLKHKYRFPNLSAADGTNRIITAKFPKADVKAVTESITYKGYTIDLEKYGNSAVCRLKDPDGICLLEYVSLATVIDVLQDELNEGEDCQISWGTIDQVIKFKRGLKSRIKQVDDEDAPVSQRGNNKTEVKEEPAKEVATDNATEKTAKQIEMEQKIADAQAKADSKEQEALKEVANK